MQRPLLIGTLVFGCALGLSVTGTAQTPAQHASTDNIRNYLKVSDDFCTGGQPKPEAFEALKADGVKAVLNLRTPGEYRADFTLEDERAAATKAGLKYFSIPVVYMDPKPAQADEFLKITDDPANRPMFIHCTAAIRVGGFWLIRRVLRDNWTWDKALDEARKVGLNAQHLEDFAKNYIASKKKVSTALFPESR